MALRCKHPLAQTFWRDNEAVAHEMKMEGDNRYHIESVLNHVQAYRKFIDDFIEGRLDKNAPVGLCASGVVARPVSLPPNTLRLPIHQKFARDIPHRKDVEGRVNVGAAKGVKAGHVLLLGQAVVQVLRVHDFASFKDMLQQLGLRRALPNARNLQDGVRIYHSFKGYERKAAMHGVRAFELVPYAPVQEKSDVKFSRAQKRAFDFGLQAIQRAMEVQNAGTEKDYDKARTVCWENNKIMLIDGPPGVGKTFVP